MPSFRFRGGADSDAILDMCERVRPGTRCKVTYGWFDTGLEYRATKRHIADLERRYSVEILRIRPEKTIPVCVRDYGQPFMSKYVSQRLAGLQRHGFRFEDESWQELAIRYPNCTSGLKWWDNAYTRNGEPGWFDIGRTKWLKEFMVLDPPSFRVSNKCCEHTKKRVAAKAASELQVDLMVVGVRRAEGGIRSALNSCVTRHGDTDQYRPLYWLSDADRDQYCTAFEIVHSDCYEVWGFKRTGCVGCPFGRAHRMELEIAREYEPNVVRAAEHIFADSHEYTARFREFQRRMSRGESDQMSLF